MLREKIASICLKCIPEDLRDNPYGKEMADISADKIIKEFLAVLDEPLGKTIDDWATWCAKENYGVVTYKVRAMLLDMVKDSLADIRKEVGK